MSDHGIRLVTDDHAEDLRAHDLEQADRLAEHSPSPIRPAASGPLPLLAGGRRAHLLTDQRVRTIAACLDLCANDLPGIDNREALELGGIRRDLLDGIGEQP